MPLPIRANLEDPAYDIWKQAVPSHVRFYLQALLGDRAKPFTEKDLTKDEVKGLAETIANAKNLRLYNQHEIERRGETSDPDYIRDKAALDKGVGNVQYHDYMKWPDKDMPGFGIADSNTFDPNTLGRFTYKRNPDGSNTVNDKYDFDNESRHGEAERYAKMSPMSRIAEILTDRYMRWSDPRYIASTVGNAFIGGNGRDVNINIPPDLSQIINNMK